MTYDCFTYNGEEDILEIRLNILDEYVDKFILCESTQTFSGKPKPLYYSENSERFKKWWNKIIVIEVPPKSFSNAFERAAYQKDCIRKYALKKYCNLEDTIYYGDVDEVWKPQKEEGKLRQLNYSYYLNNRSSEEWQGTNVFRYKNIKNLNEIRADHSVVLNDGGWHFTNAMNPDMIRRKLESYDHAEFDTDEIKSQIEKRIENNEDYVGRKFDWLGNPFTFWIEDENLPQYLKDNREKYKHLFK